MGLVSLKSGVFVSSFEGGVVFRGGETPVVFRGRRAHDLVQVLRDKMERGVTRGGLLEQLPVAARAPAGLLLDDLGRHQLLRERDDDDPDPVGDLPRHFANFWNYLANHQTRPGETLERWRGTTFQLAGSVVGMLYAARALAECGARCFIVTYASERSKSDALTPSGLMETLRQELPGSAISLGSGSSERNGTVRVFCGGDAEFSEADGDLSDAWYFGLLSAHLMISYAPGCLATAVTRWRSVLRPAKDGVGRGRLSGQRVGLAAAGMAFAVFNCHAGIESEADWETPRRVALSSRIEVIPLPAVPRIVEGRISTEAPGTAEAVPANGVAEGEMEEATVLFHPVAGFLEQVEDDHVQVPLSVVHLQVLKRDRTSVVASVWGWGVTLGEARRRAIRRGVVAHLMSDPEIARRACSLAVEYSSPLSVANAKAAAWIQAWEQAGGEPCDLPVESIHQADTRKLFQLLGLVAGAEPTLSFWSSDEPKAARVCVKIRGQTVGEACAWSVQLAAYEALGDACLAVQLPDLSMSSAAGERRPVCGRKGRIEDAAELTRIELGYPAVSALLHCSMVDGEIR